MLLGGGRAEALSVQFRGERCIGRKGEMARTITLLEPAVEIECAGITFELKLNVSSSGHRLFARKSGQLIGRNHESGVAIANMIIALAHVTQREMNLLLPRFIFDQPLIC